MINFDEESLYIPIKTAAEYFFCQRAAFYMLNNWENDLENEFLFKGTQSHNTIEKIPYKHRVKAKLEYRYRVVSEKHKIYGVCDAVEFHENREIIPVEYKTGKIRNNFMHLVQLHLQAMCLEEMFKIKLPYAYIYFTDSRARQKIRLNNTERRLIISKLNEFQEKLKKPKIDDFVTCGNIHCSYHTIDNPLLYI
jgi:CRISPR-associated exonuclease Cas4